MAAAIIKSCLYLGAFGTLGYVLMKVTEPSEEKKQAIRNTGFKDPQSNEVKTQKALFLEKLKEASTGTPIYLKKSNQNSEQEPKQEAKQPSKREINWINQANNRSKY